LEATKQQTETMGSPQTEHASQFQAQQSAPEHDGQLQWFITGAMVLFAGWILGRITAGRRNRRNGLSLDRF
jgi:hypothetical protein